MCISYSEVEKSVLNVSYCVLIAEFGSPDRTFAPSKTLLVGKIFVHLPELNDLTGGTRICSSTFSLFKRVSDHPAAAFSIFYVWVYSKSIFQSSCKEYILFSVTTGTQKHNKHLSLNSIATLCIILPFFLFCSWKYSRSLFLLGSSGLGLNNVLDSSMSNSFKSHLFCLGKLVTGFN